MIDRFFGWIIIFVQFFVLPQFREQVMAVQTIFCAATIQAERRPFHVATLALLITVSPEQVETDLTKIILLHIAIFSAVLIEYKSQKWRFVAWVSVAWSVRWLGCQTFYDSPPARASLKCVVYIIIANLRQKYLDGNYFKDVWVVLVHEICWVIIPIQMMREIYRKKKKKDFFIV
tara:strand:- start:629 stop:1153 length:525 start_codon:yes stop_codon:yes gene_type:complete